MVEVAHDGSRIESEKVSSEKIMMVIMALTYA